MQPRAAQAHGLEPAVLTLTERSAGQFHVAVRLPGLLSDPAPDPTNDPRLRPRFPAHCQARGELLDCGATGLWGADLALDSDGAPVEVLLIVRTLDAQVFSSMLRSDGVALALPRLKEPRLLSAAQVVRRYVALGAQHIASGPDHLLFVAGLLLLAGGLRRVILTLTAFTLGHSATLALAVLGVVRPSLPLIEVLIALSVLLLARELAVPPGASPPSLSRRFPAALALVFGLLHGLGFAGALAQAGLPAAQLPLSLLSFNIGVELGQVLFVLAVQLPLRGLLWAARRRPRLMRVPAYALGGLAMLWTLQRLDLLLSPEVLF